MKHAQATAVEIALVFSETHLIVNMADNGRGFDITSTNKGTIRRNGAGIKNMTSRATLIGGELTIHMAPGVLLTGAYTIGSLVKRTDIAESTRNGVFKTGLRRINLQRHCR